MEKLSRRLFLLTLMLAVTMNTLVLGIPLLPSFVLSLFLTLGIYAFKGFEPENLTSVNTLFVNDFIGSVVSGLAFLTLYPLFRSHINKYDLVISVLLLSLSTPILSHLTFKSYLKSVPPKRYLVVGKREELCGLEDEIRDKTFGKVLFVDYINPTPTKLLERLKTADYDAVLIADPKFAKDVENILKTTDLNLGIEHLPSVVERYAHRIPTKVIEKFSEYYMVFFENVKGDSPAKRILDVLISVIALVVFSPVMLIISLAIMIEDGFPIIFKQVRLGKHGERFVLHKFRSMRDDPEDGSKRITLVGRFIRSYRLDELPQFFDVLLGNMSVVGPRPEQEELAHLYERAIPFYRYRHLVKPGLTGWAQINYKHSMGIEETEKKLSYDLWYVKNRNIFLDLRIILQTLETMFFKRGAR